MIVSSAPAWVVILAGGDGVRLRSLTERITGDARPKQFCALLGSETLLERTRRRASLMVRDDRHVVVVTRAHERYWRSLAHEVAPGRLVVQPDNRGTAAGILYPLLRIRELAGDVPVAVFPSDHYVGEDAVFAEYVRHAVDLVTARPDVVTLLGVEPCAPETDYGWIEHAERPLRCDGEPVFPITRFWEKPSAEMARALYARGCLWNTFVMVGRVGAFLRLVERTAPRLAAAFAPIGQRMGTPAEVGAAERVYASLPPLGFADTVLAAARAGLVAMRLKGIEWSDLGDPARVLASLRRSGRKPPWLGPMELAASA